MDATREEILLFLLGRINVLIGLELRFGRGHTTSLEQVDLVHEWYDTVRVTSHRGGVSFFHNLKISFHSIFFEEKECQPVVKILRRRFVDELRLVRTLVSSFIFKMQYLPLLTLQHLSPIQPRERRFIVLKPKGLAIFSRALEEGMVVLTLEWDYSYDGLRDYEPLCPSGKEAVKVYVESYQEGFYFSHSGGDRGRDAVGYLMDGIPEIKPHKS